MNIKQELRHIIKKHENDNLKTFQTNISAMAKDCLREIESLEEGLYISKGEVQGLSEKLVKLEKDCDYWKREALKWCNEIGEQRIGPLLWMDEERGK